MGLTALTYRITPATTKNMQPNTVTTGTELDTESIAVTFDLSINSITAIKKAVYKFAGDCSAILSTAEPNQLKAELSFPETISLTERKAVVRALCNEVIDQDLREQIAQETEAIRNLILAQAFSKTSLLQQD